MAVTDVYYKDLISYQIMALKKRSKIDAGSDIYHEACCLFQVVLIQEIKH